jgi:RHS repeat-associated protein
MDAPSYRQDLAVTDLSGLVTLYSLFVVNEDNTITLHTDINGTQQDYLYSKDDSGRLYSTTYNLPGSTGVEKQDYFSTNGYGQLTGSTLKINGTTRLQKDYTYRTISGVAFTGQVANEAFVMGSSSSSYGYSYDNLGNITRIQKTVNNVTTDLFRYQYDEAGQLIREDDVASNQTTTWQYDAGGNIRYRRVFPLTAAGTTPDPQSMTDEVPYVYSTGIWKDQLTSYDGQSIVYDSMGNPTTYLGATLTWTMSRQLASYSKNGTTIQYTYNDEGIRTSKTVNGVRTDYYLNGTQVIAEVTNGSSIDYRYDGNGKLIALRWNGNEYYYVTNIQGDVIGLIDGNGASVVEYSYDAWGHLTAVSGSMSNTLGVINPIRFKGYRIDIETNLFYLQNRYYNASVNRFINADNLALLDMLSSSADIANLYRYCYNQPINQNDSNGYGPFLPFLIFSDRALIHHMVATFVYVVIGAIYGFDNAKYGPWVTGAAGNGFLDVYNKYNNEYYEIKSLADSSSLRTAMQMMKYDVACTKYSTAFVKRGRLKIFGTFNYGAWIVEFYYKEPGLIVYREPKFDSELAKAYYTIQLFTIAVVLSNGLALSALPRLGTVFDQFRRLVPA